jgi:hypothetical protein
MSTWVAAAIAVAAILSTYFFCVRPAMRGRCATSVSPGPGAENERQLAELREEVRVLRAQDSLDSGRVHNRQSTPPTDA